jgi:AcrR family transcriptional regulator
MGASVSVPKRRKAARRSEILTAAREVFGAKAYDAASISEIATRADCVEGTIYTYFSSKRALFDAVLAEFYDQLIADIEPQFDSIRGTRDRLSFLVARHLQIAVDDPGVSRMIMRESRGQETYFGSKLHALNRRYSRFILKTLSDGVARGELRGDLDASMARDMMFGGLEHWVWTERGRHRSVDPAKAADRIVGMLLDGWRAPAGGGAQAGDEIDAIRERLERLESKVNAAGRRR